MDISCRTDLFELMVSVDWEEVAARLSWLITPVEVTVCFCWCVAVATWYFKRASALDSNRNSKALTFSALKLSVVNFMLAAAAVRLSCCVISPVLSERCSCTNERILDSKYTKRSANKNLVNRGSENNHTSFVFDNTVKLEQCFEFCQRFVATRTLAETSHYHTVALRWLTWPKECNKTVN